LSLAIFEMKRCGISIAKGFRDPVKDGGLVEERRAMFKRLLAVGCLSVSSLFAVGCTVEDPVVENPTVNQDTGDGDDNVVIECRKSCDSVRTDCVAKCTDDSCKASCSTKKDDCYTDCD